MLTCDKPTELRVRSLIHALASLDARLPRTELIQRALEGARAITGAERSTLFLLAPDGPALLAHGTAGPSVLPFRCAVDKGIAGACYRTAAPLVIHDARLDPRFNAEIDQRTGFETRAIVCVPLVDPEHGVRGVLQALSSNPGRFEVPDAEALRAHAWPGNVREVERAVEHAALAARTKEELDVADVREALTRDAAEAERLPAWLAQGTWKERHARFDRAVIAEELERCGGSPSAASRTLDYPRPTLYRRRMELGMGGGDEAE